MSVNLQKGQKVNLKKNDKEELKRIMVGLGWDEVEQKKGLFGFLKTTYERGRCVL